MTAGARPTRLTIVEDHVLFAESVAATLAHEGYLVKRINLADSRATLASVLACVLRSVPRVVLLDLDLGRIGDGIRLVAPLAGAGVSVVALTDGRRRGGECLRRGAKAVVPTTGCLEEVLAAVGRVRDGLPAMAAAERAELVEAALRDREEARRLRARLEHLTPREREILGALMDGAQVRDIARTCVVAEATVRTQVKSILAKLDVRSQVAAVGAAARVGWRPPGPDRSRAS
ncbi:response regulator transcription factor [Nocardioides daeguensis]|uniref:Response regulator transcription factor n=1 Tax=Nocardioides daeguensis TaxID=908359 RepID=A0ABP6UVL3_9ACTN|nr:LuxR C-terminal-related transcriptional regulator [Nocardioides daeguensis]MBV6725998.1 LuxR C-terminal-related transcriptional regulator [Nocardioides daeguensis]MCR1772486.1 LuxR C-terminal-related transcriptional regulator [Nocardioides daeguensis]